ncbi:MAG: VOC family protein [Thiogranum sp.]|nr:VOC family protein [Thiogranum sp.]
MDARIHHVSLITGDLSASIAFYADLLGVSVDPGRPDLGYPGAWLNVGDQQIHLLVLPNPDPIEGRPAHVGRDRHVAFSVGSIAQIEARLEAAGTPFTRSRSGRRALFCRDPDGNGVELIEAP